MSSRKLDGKRRSAAGDVSIDILIYRLLGNFVARNGAPLKTAMYT